LAPLLAKETLGILRRINQDEGVLILLVEQNANAAPSLADYGYIMENGAIAYHDTTERLKENSTTKKFHLGLAANGGRRGYYKSPDA
jgi:branched-chain amino acid transport system ATP-binding protein